MKNLVGVNGVALVNGASFTTQMVPVVFVVTLGGGNAYAALPVNITVFGQASLIVLHRPKPLKKQHFSSTFCPLI